ncbi:hypothetical protein PHYSODRAFT_436347, partial [Phytophthora sojae]
TPLFVAAACGHATVAKLLLDFGASTNVVKNDGVTPLTIASMNGHDDVVTILLEGGASLNP